MRAATCYLWHVAAPVGNSNLEFRPGTALVLYQCTTVPGILYEQTVPYQNFFQKASGTRAISTLSTEFGPFARLCAMMAHENERIARENEKNEARRDEGAEESGWGP